MRSVPVVKAPTLSARRAISWERSHKMSSGLDSTEKCADRRAITLGNIARVTRMRGLLESWAINHTRAYSSQRVNCATGTRGV